MRSAPLASLVLASAAWSTAAFVPSWLPGWATVIPNASLPLAGLKQVPGFEPTRVYKATPELGGYNHAAMMLFYQGQMLLTWKNSPRNEDQAGQRVLYSQSLNGVDWTPTDGTNIMFPNVSTNSNPAHLFAEPPVVLNGHMYAAASPTQFCLWPDQYQPVLLMRRVYTESFHNLGPVFWASSTIPPGFEPVSASLGIVTIDQMDAETQRDIALLTPHSRTLPCHADLEKDGTNKCEACDGGCQDWNATSGLNLSNERTHYIVRDERSPTGLTDVLLYRSRVHQLYASTRVGGAGYEWSDIEETAIPDIDSNINTGTLPDGRTFLVSNAVPNAPIRDPLTIATSRDGQTFDRVAVAISCTELLPGGNSTDPCYPSIPGGAKEPGPSYPQAVVVDGWDGWNNGLYIVTTNNKEDVWVIRLPFENI
jgi:hypothetical protein